MSLKISLTRFCLSSLVIAFSIIRASAADDCPTIRLDRNGGSMEDVPVRDQGDLGICYAISATQIFDAWRKTHPSAIDEKLRDGTSPVYASILYALDEDNDSLNCPKIEGSATTPLINGGTICETVESIFEKGVCSDRTVQAALTASQPQASTPFSVAMLKNFYNDKLLADLCDELRRSNACPPGSGAADRTLDSKAKKQVSAFAATVLTDFKKELDRRGCDPNLRPKKACAPSCTDESIHPFGNNRSAIRQRIQRELSRPKALPIGMGICAASLRPDGLITYWKESQGIRIPKDRNWTGHSKCGLHNVLVIGQQKNHKTGKCQFVLRNSWGTGCGTACNNNRCSCEEGTGNILIDQDYAVSNSSDISVVSDRKCR